MHIHLNFGEATYFNEFCPGCIFQKPMSVSTVSNFVPKSDCYNMYAPIACCKKDG